MASSILPAQSDSFLDLYSSTLPDELRKRYVGKSIDELRTPAMVIDRAVFAQNCAEMHKRAALWNWSFRAHIKTHKTIEGTRLQLKSTGGTTHSMVASTMQEAWLVVQGGLVADGTVKDILYGLPVGINKLDDLAKLADTLKQHGGILRIFVDSPEHVQALEAYNAKNGRTEPWNAFFKVDLGSTKRAGLVPGSDQFLSLLNLIVPSKAITLHGFYCHAGTSYASTSLSEASSWLTAEITGVLDAAQIARTLLSAAAPPGLEDSSKQPPFVLSVGSTPTAHAFSAEALSSLNERLHAAAGENATFELHAGNYPMLDLQQVATSLVPLENVSQRIVASVISTYPGRGKEGGDEAMCDAGGLAMTRDTGPIEGFGDVVSISHAGSTSNSSKGLGCATTGWRLTRMSQEHGILTRKAGASAHPIGEAGDEEVLKVGDTIEIVGQHACVIAAAYPWYYVVDSSEEDCKVSDVWLPCKGW